MMRKILMTLVAVVCFTMTVFAQTDRNRTYRITLNNVEYAHHGEKMSAGDAVGKILSGVMSGKATVQVTQYEEDAKNAIIKGLSSAYRFRFNNGLLQLDDIAEEGNIVVDAVIMNLQTTSDGKSLDDKKFDYKTSTTYSSIAEVLLTLKDARSRDIITNFTVKGKSGGIPAPDTSEKAIHSALSHLSHNISAWLNNYRPLRANVIEGAAVKKDKQKEVYIDLGSKEGAFVGLQMGVYVVNTVAGREAKSQIGKLKIEAVEGDDISRCKVQSGGKEIKVALDAGQQLQVTSIDK